MNSKKSMIEIAYETLTKHKNGLSFTDLFNKIVKECDINDDEKKVKLVMFYNNLTLDGRFCHLVDKDLWTLRHTPDETVNFNEDENVEISADEEEEEREETHASKPEGEEETSNEETTENSEEN